MYLHLGQNVVVPEKYVIGIFDMDNTTNSHITRKFLSDAEKAGVVINISDELPNSFVYCDEAGTDNTACGREDKAAEPKIYLSQLSSPTLFKRSETMRFE